MSQLSGPSDVGDIADIRVAAFFLADHAEAVNGKLYVTGGAWEALYVTNTPVHHPHMSIVIVLRVPWSATGAEHTVQVRTTDPDGQPVVPALDGRFHPPRPDHMAEHEESTAMMVLNLMNTPITSTGSMRFELLVDGEPLTHTRVKVIQRT